MKKISTLLLCIVLASALALAATAVGCKSSGTDKPNENQGDNDMNNDKIIATIEMENGGVMKLELYPEIAPQSVYNFVSLARSGFYDGLTFHRIIPGFMIKATAAPAIPSRANLQATASTTRLSMSAA